jgi:uncharacterized protein (DUF1778 family)
LTTYIDVAHSQGMRQATIMLRVSDDEKAELQAAADRDERTLSDWLRRIALGVARRPVFIGKDE